MADIYQMAKNDEPLAGMEVAGSFLCHVHLSDPDRMPPSNPENFDFYREAFGVLKQMGYQGRASIEARITDFETHARRGLEVVKQLWAD
jgi:sugar phosphate isomerase/epimerase